MRTAVVGFGAAAQFMHLPFLVTRPEFQVTTILQRRGNEAAEKYPPFSYWLWDGVHPMPNGHEMIALDWRLEVGKKLKFIV